MLYKKLYRVKFEGDSTWYYMVAVDLTSLEVMAIDYAKKHDVRYAVVQKVELVNGIAVFS